MPAVTRDVVVPVDLPGLDDGADRGTTPASAEDPQLVLAKLRGDLVRLLEHLKGAEGRAKELKGPSGDAKLVEHLKKAVERTLKAKTRAGVLASDLATHFAKGPEPVIGSDGDGDRALREELDKARTALAAREVDVAARDDSHRRELEERARKAADEARESVRRLAEQELNQLKEKTKELLRKAADEIRRLKGEPGAPAALDVGKAAAELGIVPTNDPEDTQKLQAMRAAAEKAAESAAAARRVDSARFSQATRAITVPSALDADARETGSETAAHSPPPAATAPVLPPKPIRPSSVKSTQILSVGNMGVWQESGDVKEATRRQKPPSERLNLERRAVRPEDIESKDPDAIEEEGNGSS